MLGGDAIILGSVGTGVTSIVRLLVVLFRWSPRAACLMFERVYVKGKAVRNQIRHTNLGYVSVHLWSVRVVSLH